MCPGTPSSEEPRDAPDFSGASSPKTQVGEISGLQSLLDSRRPRPLYPIAMRNLRHLQALLLLAVIIAHGWIGLVDAGLRVWLLSQLASPVVATATHQSPVVCSLADGPAACCGGGRNCQCAEKARAANREPAWCRPTCQHHPAPFSPALGRIASLVLIDGVGGAVLRAIRPIRMITLWTRAGATPLPGSADRSLIDPPPRA